MYLLYVNPTVLTDLLFYNYMILKPTFISQAVCLMYSKVSG